MHIFAEPRGLQFCSHDSWLHWTHICNHVLLHTHTAGGQNSLTFPQQWAEVAEGVWKVRLDSSRKKENPEQTIKLHMLLRDLYLPPDLHKGPCIKSSGCPF